jgi:hypothetical protein
MILDESELCGRILSRLFEEWRAIAEPKVRNKELR